MKKINFYILSLIAVTCFIWSGCSDDNDGVRAITIKEAAYANNRMELKLKDNATLALTPFVMPQSKSDVAVTYAARHPEWMKVENHVIIPTLFSGGETIYDPVERIDTLTVSADGLSVNYTVIITNHYQRVRAINLTATGANISIKKGGTTFDLSKEISFTPADAHDQSVTYESSDEEIVTISADGVITSKDVEGTAEIIIKTLDGGDIVRTANVKVLGFQPEELDRTGWTATASPALEPEGFNYTPAGIFWVPDKVTTGGKLTLIGGPECLFDDDPLTYFCLEKPGRGTYACKPGANGWSMDDYGQMLTDLIRKVAPDADPAAGTSANPASDVVNYFVVDMKAKQKFSYLVWRHRNAANNRVTHIDLYGSNDDDVFTKPDAEVGSKWTKLNDALIDLSAKSNNDEMKIDITPDQTEFEYRYVKVVAVEYPSSGMTFGVAEFNLGINK